MGEEFKLFFTALSFYTRIPVPAFVYKDHAKHLPASIRYLPVVGWITGAVAGLVYMGAVYLFGSAVAVLLSMTATVLITGAFHEDGFADVCDGFGGGWTKEKILLIMKDSRLGTYGVTGLILLLGVKFTALQQLFSAMLVPLHLVTVLLLFIVAQSLSRFAAITLVFNYNYARIEESKASGAVEKGGLKNLVIATLLTVLPLVLLILQTSKPVLLIIVIPVLLVIIFLSRYFKKWIGGYTGDCLGAVQQLTEVVIYLSYLILWKFT